MSSEFYEKHGRRNLFDDKAKQQQIKELEAAYVQQGNKLQQQISEAQRKVREAQSKMDRAHRATTSSKQTTKLARAQQELRKSERSLEKLQAKQAAMPENQRLGIDAIQTARVWREPDGRIFIEAKVAPAQPRLKYENENRCGLETRPGFEKAHGRGAGTGFECDCGILHAPTELNQGEQRQGIEAYAQKLRRDLPPKTDLWLTNEISAHPGTSNLKSNTYTFSCASRDANAKKTEMFSIELRDKAVGGTRIGSYDISRNHYKHSISEAQEGRLRSATKERPKAERQTAAKSRAMGNSVQSSTSRPSVAKGNGQGARIQSVSRAKR